MPDRHRSQPETGDEDGGRGDAPEDNRPEKGRRWDAKIHRLIMAFAAMLVFGSIIFRDAGAFLLFAVVTAVILYFMSFELSEDK